MQAAPPTLCSKLFSAPWPDFRTSANIMFKHMFDPSQVTDRIQNAHCPRTLSIPHVPFAIPASLLAARHSARPLIIPCEAYRNRIPLYTKSMGGYICGQVSWLGDLIIINSVYMANAQMIKTCLVCLSGMCLLCKHTWMLV